MNKKKVVLLITGQKSRLELLSKTKNIIKPLSNNFDVSVVLSLSKTNNYTNRWKYKKGLLNLNCDIGKKLEKFTFYINNINYPNLKVNRKIISMLDKKGMSRRERINRGLNHVRQYYTLFNSWPIIKKINPDFLIRIRDDAFFKKPINTIINLSKNNNLMFPKKSIITSIYNMHRGINDKFAIVSKEAIKIYLTKPFIVYYNFNNILGKNRISNCEQFIKKVYIKFGISLHFSNIEIKILKQYCKFNR